MKPVLKPIYRRLSVWTLTSCLTTLQFSTLAWAQEPLQADLKMDAKPIVAVQPKAELATPSFMLAPQKGFQAELGYGQLQAEYQLKNLTGKADYSKQMMHSEFAAGFASRFFAGAAINYQSSKRRSDFAIITSGAVKENYVEGVEDPTLSLGARMNFNTFSGIVKVKGTVPTGNAEIQTKELMIENRNAKLGGTQFGPEISLFRNNKSALMFGGGLGYIIRQDRKIFAKDQNGFNTEIKESGGNTMTANVFLESPQTTHSGGLLVEYSKAAAAKIEANNRSAEIPDIELATATAYGNIKIGKSFAILPQASYMHYISKQSDAGELTSQSAYSGMLNLRLLF
jgi:hypothetical protein